MKKIFIGCSLLLAAISANAGVIVKGNWERKNTGSSVSLYRIEHGRTEEIASYKLGPDRQFGFFFEPEKEGLYVIGATGPSQMDKYTFYFQKQDELSIRVNDSSYALSKASPENREMERWHNFIQPLEWKSIYFNKSRSTYVDYFPDLEAKAPAALQYVAKKTGNARFDAVFAQFRQFDLHNCAIMFLSTPRTKHPQTSELPAFYRNINTAALTRTAAILQYPSGQMLLGRLSRIEYRIKGVERPDIAQIMDVVPNDTLRGEVMLDQAGMARTYLGYQEVEKQYGRYLLTADQQARNKEIIAKIAKAAAKPGTPAIDFRYPDIDGKSTALSDFKGKVVVVDVWATWCGPCKAEIPALKKMEEEMRGQDVVFMSVSVDEQKDFQKWKDFVAKEELKGVQLFASGWSDIAKFYEIKGIPRFMVFNKKGEIVSTDAPRPSSPELKLLLTDELKK
ncbi:TlpA family protein disulfide reductase [Chitinophaga lutea]